MCSPETVAKVKKKDQAPGLARGLVIKNDIRNKD